MLPALHTTGAFVRILGLDGLSYEAGSLGTCGYAATTSYDAALGAV